MNVEPINSKGKGLTAAQERLWFVQQLCPDAAQNVSVSVRLRGALNFHALEQGFTDLLQRYAVLRTAFVNVKGRPVSQIAPAVAFNLETKDLSLLPKKECETQAQELVEREQQ